MTRMTQQNDPAPIVFMFAGQGSQYFQMGRQLYELGGNFSHWMRYFDKLMLEMSGRSVLATLYSHKKSDPFVDTSLTNPAIFMLEVALAQELIGRGIRPNLTLGVSMGSFAAAVISGCMRAEDALALVVQQANAFIEQCSPGGMIAVLAGSQLYQHELSRRNAVIASYNFKSHFVLSARDQHLPEIAGFLGDAGTSFQSLRVAFAYHSPWIEDARISLERTFSQATIEPATIPLVCCARSQILSDLPLGFFWDAVRQPVRFQDTIAYLEAQGPHRYLDVGATGTLMTFLKYLLPANTKSTFDSIMTAYDQDTDKLHSVVNAFRGKCP
jgi:bacillaene synthase trans-acting acyltransferase